MDDEKTKNARHVEHMERTSVLANERTYAAWIRTGLAAFLTAMGGEKLLQGVISQFSIRLAAMLLLTASVMCFVLAAWRYDHVSSRMESASVSGAPKFLLHLLSALLVIVSVASALGLWLIF